MTTVENGGKSGKVSLTNAHIPEMKTRPYSSVEEFRTGRDKMKIRLRNCLLYTADLSGRDWRQKEQIIF